MYLLAIFDKYLATSLPLASQSYYGNEPPVDPSEFRNSIDLVATMG